METKNIMIVGVGGQGSLLASKLLGHLLMEQGFDVKVSEVHGMSQRGGSVVTYVRYGDRVDSPVIDKGEADYIVSFELLEAARWLSYLKPDGQIVTSTQQIDPMPVITGAASYPENLVEKMRAAGAKVDALDCLKLAEEAGSAKAVNIVLMGRLSHYFDLPDQAWQKSLEAMVPPKFLELNKKAFELGKNNLAYRLTVDGTFEEVPREDNAFVIYAFGEPPVPQAVFHFTEEKGVLTQVALTRSYESEGPVSEGHIYSVGIPYNEIFLAARCFLWKPLGHDGAVELYEQLVKNQGVLHWDRDGFAIDSEMHFSGYSFFGGDALLAQEGQSQSYFVECTMRK